MHFLCGEKGNNKNTVKTLPIFTPPSIRPVTLRCDQRLMGCLFQKVTKVRC